MVTIRSPHALRGGVHPEYNKTLTASEPIRELPLPARLTVPMSQHLGAPAKPVVKVGDTVVFARYGDTEIKEGGREYLILREDDIVAVVTN